MTKLVDYQMADGIARITMDDGKVNVMSPAMLGQLHAAFDRAEQDQAVVILTGREKAFSAGFDLKVIRGNDAIALHSMLTLGAELALRILSFPRPVVAACTGHALPMGAFLMLASDVRVGIDGPFRIGLNEVFIGITIPTFGVELARQRMTPPYFNRIVTGELLAPGEAVRAGYLDQVVTAEALVPTVDAVAQAMTGLDRESHRATKLRVRGPAIRVIRAAIDAELTMEQAEATVAGRASVA